MRSLSRAHWASGWGLGQSSGAAAEAAQAIVGTHFQEAGEQKAKILRVAGAAGEGNGAIVEGKV